ncbi:MAG: VOC family protein [Tepidiformaceae bacterium]
MPGPIVFFQIASTDPERASEFFGALFDWQYSPGGLPGIGPSIDPQGPADFDPKGSFLQLPEGAPPFVSIFVRVSDLAATLEKAKSLGASVRVPVTRIPTGADIAVIVAPEGHVVGIVQE